MAKQNRGAELPAGPQEKWYMVVGPKGTEALYATLLADTFTGIWVHWDGRVLPCSNTPDCALCRTGKGNRWQGYIAAWQHSAARRVVLAVSEGAARQLRDIKVQHATLRGVSVKTYRRYTTKVNSRQIVEKVSFTDDAGLMAEHDIMPSINRLLGMNEARVSEGATGGFQRGLQDDGEGVCLPPAEIKDEQKRPTPEQCRRLREALGGFGSMPQ